MKKANPSIPRPGLLCGFFERGAFRIGLVTGLTETRCQITVSGDESLALPRERLVLVSAETYPQNDPAAVLAEFRAELETCRASLDLAAIRSQLLQRASELTLPELFTACSLPDSDACRFSLFLALRDRPAWFRCRKGNYSALSEVEEQAFLMEDEQQELRRQDALACPLLARKGLPVLFSPALLEEAQQIPDYEWTPDRMDLSRLNCWTIDAASSRDLDDALSLEEAETGWEFGIHITDVSWFLKQDSALDQEALRRSSSIYLPDRDVHMLPESLSCGKASLLEGSLRPALSVVCRISPEWEIVSWLVFPSQIRASRNYTYEEFEAWLAAAAPAFNPEMRDKARLLRRITERRLEERIRAGALVPPDAAMTPARRLVAECMVIYNSILTGFVPDDTPLFFRSLQDPDSAGAGLPAGKAWLPPSRLGTESRPHAGMGLLAYARFSSPLRRYSDLVNQRQASAFMNGDKLPYEKESLDGMLDHLARARQQIRQVTQQAEAMARL